MTDMSFREMLVEAIADLKPRGRSLDAALDPFAPPKSAIGARALGFLEGAAAALDVTVRDLLDEFDLR
jgi:hypothetical protein